MWLENIFYVYPLLLLFAAIYGIAMLIEIWIKKRKEKK